MKFELNKKELKSAKKWQKKIIKKHGIEASFSYIFTPTGIGTCVEIEHKETGNIKNITDFSSW